jgi:hypothetical protein
MSVGQSDVNSSLRKRTNNIAREAREGPLLKSKVVEKVKVERADPILILNRWNDF